MTGEQQLRDIIQFGNAYFAQCDWKVRFEHGPLLPVDGELCWVLQLPIFCAVFGVHERWLHICGGRHADEVPGPAAD